jgi:hypothetical protein
MYANNKSKNWAHGFLDRLGESNTSLEDVKVPSGLEQVLKFNFAGTNYLPFELDKSMSGNSVSFIEGIIQPAMAAKLEGDDFDFAVLDAWNSECSSLLKDYFKYTGLTSTKGGAPIVFNEIVLGILKTIEGTSPPGGTKHPRYSYLKEWQTLFVDGESPNNAKIARALFDGNALKMFTGSDAKHLANLKNLDQWHFHTGMTDPLKYLAGGSDLGLGLYNLGFEENYGTLPPVGSVYDQGTACEEMLNGTYELPPGYDTVLDFGGLTSDELDNFGGLSPIDDVINGSHLKNLINIYIAYSTLYQHIFHGIQNGIEVLLASEGLLQEPVSRDFSTASNSSKFYETRVPQGPDATLSTISGEHEYTRFSGIPMFLLYELLARCIQTVSEGSSMPFLNTAGISGPPEQWIRTQTMLRKYRKLVATAVENTDETKGPVRWKMMTESETSTAGGYVSQVTIEDFWDWNSIPQFGNNPDALNQGGGSGGSGGGDDASNPAADFNNDGTVTGAENLLYEQMLAAQTALQAGETSEDISEEYSYPALTLVLNNENKFSTVSFTTTDRGNITTFFSSLIKNRNQALRYRKALDIPVSAYREFPTALEQIFSKPLIEAYSSFADLPGIDAVEIIKFLNKNQVSLARKTLRRERNSTLKYLPNKYAISTKEYMNARQILVSYFEAAYNEGIKSPNSPRPVINVVGIPNGFISSLGDSPANYLSISQGCDMYEYPLTPFTSKAYNFSSNISLIPGSLSLCELGGSSTDLLVDYNLDEIIKQVRYFYSDEKTSWYMNYDEAMQFFKGDPVKLNQLLKNHVIDYCLKLVLKATTNIDFDEDTFRINDAVNKKFVSSSGLATAKKMTAGSDLDFSFIPGGRNLPPIKEIQASNVDLSQALGILDCRLITPEEIAKKTLAPRLFDRIFCFVVHPSQHKATAERPLMDRDPVTNLYSLDYTNSRNQSHCCTYYYQVTLTTL